MGKTTGIETVLTLKRVEPLTVKETKRFTWVSHLRADELLPLGWFFIRLMVFFFATL